MTYSTKQIEDAFDAAGERMTEIEKTAEDNSRFIGGRIDDLGKQLKALVRSGVGSRQDESGFWPNSNMAKEFGELVFDRIWNRKEMGTNVNTAGGFLVPEEMADTIIDKLGRYGVFRKYATRVKTGAALTRVPMITSDLTVYCPGEGNAITSSDVNFGMVNLYPKKLATLSVINRELEEDAMAGLGEIVAKSITRSMAKTEDLIGFLGDGTRTYIQYKGIINSLLEISDTISEIKGLQVASGNAYSEITLDDFYGVVSRLPDEADAEARWYMNKKFYYQVVYPLAAATGIANMFDIISPKKERYFLGYPVEFVSCMPSTEANSQICAILGDLSLGAYLGETRQLEIARSDDVYFASDQIGIRSTQRISVNVFGVGDTEEAGPIVGLITAAS